VTTTGHRRGGARAGDGFPWPPLREGGPAPTWDGTRFLVDREQRFVLEYSRDEAAWDASLTGFHEETASSDHPIDLASRRQAIAGLKRSVVANAPVILEVGSSSGFLLPLLREAFPGAFVIGSDAFPETLRALAARADGFPLLQFDLARCPLPDSCVDAVVALNVLEHIADDGKALAQIARVLRPGGVAYIEVPAGARLYDIYDELLRHYRRYSAAGVAELSRRAGLDPVRVTHLGCLVFPLFVLAKRRNQRLLAGSPAAKRAEVARNIGASRRSTALGLALALEERLGRLIRFPFGIRVLLLLRKGV
jgi:SAM-dependent methyltransferase